MEKSLKISLISLVQGSLGILLLQSNRQKTRATIQQQHQHNNNNINITTTTSTKTTATSTASKSRTTTSATSDNNNINNNINNINNINDTINSNNINKKQFAVRDDAKKESVLPYYCCILKNFRRILGFLFIL